MSTDRLQTFAAPPPEGRSPAASPRALDLAAAPAPAASPRVLDLAGGARVEAATDAQGVETLHLRDRGGACVLTIRMTPEGPVLALEGVSLEIAASRSLTLRSEELLVQASRAQVEITGDLVEEVGGAVRRRARGELDVQARRLTMEATSGDALLRASDDVALTGERVRLNSDDPPMPLSMADFEARRRGLPRPR
jgi:hypothetical protein